MEVLSVGQLVSGKMVGARKKKIVKGTIISVLNRTVVICSEEYGNVLLKKTDATIVNNKKVK